MREKKQRYRIIWKWKSICDREMEIPRKEERPRMKRREKDAPRKIEMDLSGEFDRQNMLKSRLEDTKEAHLAVLEDYKRKKM